MQFADHETFLHWKKNHKKIDTLVTSNTHWNSKRGSKILQTATVQLIVALPAPNFYGKSTGQEKN